MRAHRRDEDVRVRRTLALLDAVSRDALHDHASLSPRLQRALERPAAQQMLRRTGERLRALGPARGVLVDTERRDAIERPWTRAIVVFGRGAHANAVLLEQRHSDDGRLDRIVVRRWRWGESLREDRDPGRLPLHRFDLPLHGEWYVLQGGVVEADNRHHGHREQHFAVDLVMQEGGRVRPPAEVETNASHYAYGRPVFAPAPGRVVRAVDGQPDTPVDATGSGGGNGVVLDHGHGEFSSMWHFQPGSLAVREGDWVERGELLGRVGNSGASSLPHLHWHLGTGWGERERIALPLWLADVQVDDQPRRWALPSRGQTLRKLTPDEREAFVAEPADPPAGRLWLDL